MPSRLTLRFFVTATFCAGLLPARAAEARDCAANSDCPKGFQCSPIGTSADGGPGVCSSLPCESDSDCGSGTRCEFDVGTECTGSPTGTQVCAPLNVCVPQWQAPCTTDSECGPGFACGGDGGAGYPGVSGAGYVQCGPGQVDASVPSYATSTTIPCADVPEPPMPPDFGDSGPQIPVICEPGSTCLSVTWKTCNAAQTACRADSDCPSTWTCGCADIGVVSTPAIFPDGAVQTSSAPCTTVCLAPNSDLSWGPLNGAAGASGTAVGSPPVPGGVSAGDGAVPLPPSGTDAAVSFAAGSGSGGGGAPSSAPASQSGTKPNEPEVPPNAADGSRGSSSGGGCEVARGSRTGRPWGVLVGLAGLVGLRARRRSENSRSRRRSA